MEWKGRGILAASIVLGMVAAHADSRNETEFDSIVQRNAFGLRDAPATPAAVYTNAPVATTNKEDFYLTGISTIGAPKHPKAYLVAKDTQKKTADQKYYNLAVGDRQGDLTLKEIDEKGRRVRIEYQGEEKWLSMRENGIPQPGGMAGTNGALLGIPGHAPQQAGASPPPLPGGNSNAMAVSRRFPTALNSRFSREANYGNAGLNTSGHASSAGPELPGLVRTGPTMPTISPGVTIANPDVPPLQIPSGAPDQNSADALAIPNAAVPTPPVPLP